MLGALGKNKLYLFAILFVIVLIGVYISYKWLAGSTEAFDGAPLESDGAATPSKVVVIFFRANWCGHCTRFKPVWDETCADKVARSDLEEVEMKEVDVDTEEAKPLMQKHNVRGFPHVVMVNGDKEDVYSGNRTKEDLLSFIESHK